MAEVSVALPRTLFGEAEAPFLSWGDLRASLFRYASGVDAVRLANQRGDVVVLPFLGQMIWSACFDGVELAMRGMFPMPRPAATIIGTYGCFAFHSGLLRNGVPGPEDDHPVHGEFPCLAMDRVPLAVPCRAVAWPVRFRVSVRCSSRLAGRWPWRSSVTVIEL